ncbi:putative pdcd2_c domain-containing protein [Diaporthe ampelina]|uniref:Putative pdcd2_c domain-containing protein n=1 Tax=Diaporthe ampelina TaxID=1214573 RepID=A0A0G2FLS3_9PEZI|nr:putative pdcd2_c domain-containing protein [Diaporthe ampelina]
MAPYDSDDSLEEDQDYTETNVLLGYATKDADEDTISRLGGRPEWLDPSKPPPSSLARCKVCNDLMVVLLQLNAELNERFPGHERRLYVFSCRRKSCRRKEGSMRALRGIRISADVAAKAKERKEKEQRGKEEREKAEAERKEKEKGLGEALFGVQGKGAFGAAGAANPFSSNSSSGGVNPFAKPAANPFSTGSSETTQAQSLQPKTEPEPASSKYSTKDLPKTFAETLSLNNPQEPEKRGPLPSPEPWPPEAEQPKPFLLSYLADADYETLDPIPAPKDVPTSMEIDDGAGAGSAGGGGKEDKDVFESTIDSTFQKFADRLAQNPEQCIRYEFNGQPLLYSKTDAVGRMLHDAGAGAGGRIPPCENCRGERVFEVQLVPGAIAELESEEEEGLEGMDWGTVIVGTCATDCVPTGTADGESGYLEEWAGVQWEELTQRR